MIILTGTKRSGTSMWMKALKAAGIPIFGEAFPRSWGDNLREANPGGFFESSLRRGIYFATNPHPVTGAYFAPEQVTWHAVKVFIPGVVRTDRAFITHVIATIRPWREYIVSWQRLEGMVEAAVERPERPPSLPAELEWWAENYTLLRNVIARGYPFHWVSYESVLRESGARMEEVFRWLGRGDAEAAAAIVDPAFRTADAPRPDHGLSDAHARVFDDFYACIDAARPMPRSLIHELNAVHEKLGPAIGEHQRRVKRWRHEHPRGVAEERAEVAAGDVAR